MESLKSVLYSFSLQDNDKEDIKEDIEEERRYKVLTMTTNKMNFIFLLNWNILPIKNNT